MKTRAYLTYGLIGAFVYVGSFIAAIETDIDYYFEYVPRALRYALILIFPFLAGLAERRARGGYIEFPEVLGPILLVFAIIELNYQLSTYIYFNEIAPDKFETIRDMKLEKGLQLLSERTELPPEVLDDRKQAFEESVRNEEMTFGGAIQLFFLYMLINIAVGFLMAAILRRKPQPAITEPPRNSDSDPDQA